MSRRQAVGAVGGRLGFVVFVALAAHPLEGQLRPLEPTDWDALDSEQRLGARLGSAVYLRQRVSLAGTRGTLYDLGDFRVTWRLGQVAIQYSGSVVRLFDEDSAFATPVPGTRPFSEDTRVDAGDHRLSTLIRFSESPGRLDASFRFGVRLPTTNNEIGLERDQTDFFATLGGRLSEGPVWAAAEIGVGVFGTRSERNEQVDPLVFAFEGRYELPWFRPFLVVLGQRDTRPTPDRRGTEDLGEARIGVVRGDRKWVRVELVRGWEAFSPDFGLGITVGLRR